MTIDRVIRDEEGFTTAGMAIALLVSLSLLFSAAQVYRVNTMAAEVQDVADASALAAENQVAEFMVAVRVADGVVLSMTLLGIVSYGLGVVGLCVPPAAEVGAQLVSAGQKVLDARDACAQRAAAALDRLQRALPFLAAASAASTAAANGQNRSCDYHAVAMLMPAEGEAITVGVNRAEASLEQAVDEGKDELAEAAEQAERATREAFEAKERAYRRDCGDNPSYCMYERADHLAGLGPDDNPLYTSIDTWSFSVALDRARAYYRTRLLSERPAGDSTEDEVRSVLRKQFYAYAIQQLREEAYVHEDGTTFDAYFPRLPRNLEQMRATSLYTAPAYPVDQEGELPMMHAWEACPNLGLTVYYGSLSVFEEEQFEICPVCQFEPSLLGNVAAASTSIDNGFEYHYDAVARAAEDYERAVREAEPLSNAVKGEAQGLFDKAAEALRGAASMRIQAHPPGSAGCIALVVSSGDGSSGVFESSFVTGGGTLGTRAAVAGATLIKDETEDASVVGDVLDGLDRDGSALVGAGRVVLDCWSAVLGAYESGQNALMEAVESALDSLPLVGAAGLGSWAADALRSGLGAVGLEPADTAPLKPVLANSGAIAQADGSAFAVRYLSVRNQALASSTSSPDAFASLADRIERDAYDRLAAGEIELAVIELPFGGVSVPVTLTLPPVAVEGARGLVEQACGVVRSATGWLGRDASWE